MLSTFYSYFQVAITYHHCADEAPEARRVKSFAEGHPDSCDRAEHHPGLPESEGHSRQNSRGYHIMGAWNLTVVGA